MIRSSFQGFCAAKLKGVVRFTVALLLAALPCLAGPSASEIARQIQQSGLDPEECYRVIETDFSKEDLRVFFTSGYLIFAKPVNGVRIGAVFTTEVEGGDAEMLLLPPLRSERMSLANFTESPNLNEHFTSALLIFTDTTGVELAGKMRTSAFKRVPEMGAMLAEKWSPTLRNIASSFQVRLAEDTLNPRGAAGFFYMAVGGAKPGNFDVFYDPKNPESLLAGQIVQRKGIDYFDVWTSFPSRSQRKANVEQAPDIVLDNYRIASTITPELLLQTVTKVTATFRQPVGRAIGFAISQQMRVLDAKVDGQPAEIFQKESVRSNLISGNGNQQFLVVTADELDPGKPHEFEFRHEGNVISKAGDQVFYVDSRGTWYPRRSSEFARYDLTFRYPKELNIVANGEVVEDTTDGPWRITRRSSATPMRFAGFNLGSYKSVGITHEPYRVIVHANRRLETALKPKAGAAASEAAQNPLPFGRRRPIDNELPPMPPAAPDPMARLQAIANDVAGAFDFMASEFGPPPMKTLTVSPIPGGFGQGFPGLLYLSTLAYLDPSQRPASARTRFQQTFYSEMLDAHEVAHQWWGNLVIPASYQDGWLMEALANYSAILFLEKKKGPRAVETLLDDYKNHLLVKQESGKTLESAGPITWGYRLQSSLAPDAWHHITYEKGAWVIHMLRRKLGDERFLAMLRAMCERYRFKAITTEQFHHLAQEFMPAHAAEGDLASFFENWVYGTGIPAVKLTYTIHGFKVSGSVAQSEVAEDFSALVPVEVVTGRQRTLYWVAAASEPVPFTIHLKAAPTKVGLAVRDALMTAKK